MDLDAGPVRLNVGARGLPGLGRGQVAEQPLDLGDYVLADVAAEADDHSLRLVPAACVAEEGVPVGGADGFLAPDDVPAERLVAVKELLVDATDVVAGRVVVHVHLFDDHALLALDLL